MISRILTNRKFGAFATAETPSPHSVWRLPPIRAIDAGEEEAQVMAKVSGNDLVANALKDEGVEKAFYLTGGPMVDVAVRCIERFRTIDFRHEQAAAVAVVALGGASAVSQAGMLSFQEMDQVGMFKPITKYAEKVIDTRRIPEIINKAFRIATSGCPGPVYVDLPGDVLYRRVDEEEVMYPKQPHSQPRISGDSDLIKKAIALLKQAQKPLILTGSGVFWSKASDELKEFVELTGIPFFTTPQGRGVIPEDHKLAFLSARNQAWKECDVLLLLGTRLNFIIGFGMPPRWDPNVKR